MLDFMQIVMQPHCDHLKEKEKMQKDHRSSTTATDRETLQRTHHVLVAVWGPHTGVSESLLLNGGLGAFAGVRDGDRALHASVKHVHRGGHNDVIADMDKK